MPAPRIATSTCLLLSVFFLLSACKELTPRNRVVVLQPLGAFSRNDAERILRELKPGFGDVLLKPSIALPESAFYPPRNRYRADSLLKFLVKAGSSDTVIVGLLNEDISTTKGAHADWGIMGLGYRPGNACVVSMFRVHRSNSVEQFYKLVLHELGHTQGLPHCPDQRCFMRDAEGGNPLDDETGFCAECKKFLLGKGWKLHSSEIQDSKIYN